MARSQSRGKASDADRAELYDATLGRVIGVFPRGVALALKLTGPQGHELHVRKVTDDGTTDA